MATRKSKKPISRTKPGSGRERRGSTARRAAMPFDRHNYLLLILFASLIVLGYVIMRIDNQVDGFVSLYLAPITLIVGYLGVFYAIMKRPKDDTEQ